jgi:hypothetical protein
MSDRIERAKAERRKGPFDTVADEAEFIPWPTLQRHHD